MPSETMNIHARKNRRIGEIILSLLMLSMLMIGALLPFTQTGSATSEIKQWETGDCWCMGYEEELAMSFGYRELLSEFFEKETEIEDSDIEDLHFEVDGIIGVYLISEVVETSPRYKIHNTASFGLHGSFSMNVKGEFYKEGHYTDVQKDSEGNYDIPKETRTIELSVDFEIAFLAKGYEYRDSHTLAITKQTFSIETSGKVTMDAKNIYDEEEGSANYSPATGKTYLDTLDIEYGSYTIKFSWDADADITSVYSPAMRSRPPTETIGDIWNVSYMVTTSGNYDGKIKASVKGDIPGDGEGYVSMYDSMDLSSSYFNSPPFVNGVIQEESSEVELQHEIVDKEIVIMPDGTTTKCLVITQRDPEAYEYDGYEGNTYYYYSPDYQRNVKMDATDLTELYPEFPDTAYSLEPQIVKTAQEFNARYADPSKVGEKDDQDGSRYLWMIGGILMIIPLVGIALYVNRPKNHDEGFQVGVVHQGFHAGGYVAPDPQGPQPIYPGVPAIAQQPQPSSQHGYYCPYCGTPAVYVPAFHRWFCRNCRNPVPVHSMLSTTQSPSNTVTKFIPENSRVSSPTPLQVGPPIQSTVQPTIQPTVRSPAYTPTHTPTHTPVLINRVPTLTGSGSPMEDPGMRKCKHCETQMIFIPHSCRHYCHKCREFQ